MHNIWYANTEAITWRKQNIINKGLEFTKHYNYSLEKCSWSTPLLLPTILQNCVFVIKLCIPRIAINIEKENYFFMSINFKHKELILCPQISINDFNTRWAFSYSIKYTFHSLKKKRENMIKNHLQSLSYQYPCNFSPHISEFRQGWSQLNPKPKSMLSSIWWPREKMEMIYCCCSSSEGFSKHNAIKGRFFNLTLTLILIYICILAKSRILKVLLNSHI